MLCTLVFPLSTLQRSKWYRLVSASRNTLRVVMHDLKFYFYEILFNCE